MYQADKEYAKCVERQSNTSTNGRMRTGNGNRIPGTRAYREFHGRDSPAQRTQDG